jgi:hypothetical protein
MAAKMKTLKQSMYVIKHVNEWKGQGTHSMQDVQGVILSAIQFSALDEETKINR